MVSKIKTIAIVLLIVAMAFLIVSPSMLAEEKLEPLPFEVKTKAPKPNPANYSADSLSYKDASIEVKGRWDRAFDTDYLVFVVKIKDISQFRAIPANGVSFKADNEMLGATIAKRANAVFAINGDYFVFDSYGFAVRQGKVLRRKPNGEDVLIVDEKGHFHTILKASSYSKIKPELSELENKGVKIYNAFSFGPTLIKDNEILIPDGKKYQYMNVGAQRLAQRISLTQVGELEYLVVSTCGPDNKGSKGLTIRQIAELTHKIANELYPEKGAMISYNLDGGSSNTVVMQNKKVNSPGSKTRPLSDMICFMTLVREENQK